MAVCHDIITNVAAQQSKEKRNLHRGELHRIIKASTPELETMEKMAAQAATPMQNYMPADAYGLLGEIPIDEQIKRNFGIGARSYIEDNDPFITAPPARQTNPFTGEQVEAPKNQASMGSILADGLGLQKVETDADREFQDDFRSASLFGSPWGMIKNGFKKGANLASDIWNGGKKLDDAAGAASKRINEVGESAAKPISKAESAMMRKKNMEPPKPSPALQKHLDELQSGGLFPHNPDNLGSKGKFIPEKEPDANEQRIVDMLESLGYNGRILKEASKKGYKSVPTADLEIEGFGRVEIYTPTSNSVRNILSNVREKGEQASTILVQKDFSLQEMQEIANKTFGSGKCKHMRYMFFASSNGKLYTFKK